MALLADRVAASCAICELPLPPAAGEREALRCGHTFCGECLEVRRYHARDDAWYCPSCSAPTGERFGPRDDVDNVLGETALHAVAARRAKPGDTAEACVARGIAVDRARADGATALFLAARLGHAPEVAELLRLRADPNATAFGWRWPLDAVLAGGNGGLNAALRGAAGAGLSVVGAAALRVCAAGPNDAAAAVLLGGGALGDGSRDEALFAVAAPAPLAAALVADADGATRDLLGFDPHDPVRGPAQAATQDDAYQALLRGLERRAVARVAARRPGFAAGPEAALCADVFRLLAEAPNDLLAAFRTAGVVDRVLGAPWREGHAWTACARFLGGGGGGPPPDAGDARGVAAALRADLERADAGVPADGARFAPAFASCATPRDCVNALRRSIAGLEKRVLDAGAPDPLALARAAQAARVSACAPDVRARLLRRIDHCASRAQVRAVSAVVDEILDPSDDESSDNGYEADDGG